MATLFVSDVHLSSARPNMVDAFTGFLDGTARSADALYILGDLFDVWLGDDDDRSPHGPVVEALARLSASGIPVSVMPGNHDFLLGGEFSERSGCPLLEDHALIDVYGTSVLCMHGDTLCTRDVDYQEFRKYARDPGNQREFLSLPLPMRVQRAAAILRDADEKVALKPADIMDVTPEAVAQVMEEHGVRFLVHGHTHRPGVHALAVDGMEATRIVLGDWYERDSVLIWDDAGYHLGRIADLGDIPQ
jgi:UDP-2,3-diacylglucosamine hydrolase